MAEKTYLHCECCGKSTERKSSSQRYCPECAVWQHKKKTMLRAEQRAKLGPVINRACERCGREIEHAKLNQHFCADCAEAAHRERLKADREKYHAPESEPKKDYTFLTPTAAPPEWSLKGKSADQVTVEARALELSYGQYSAYCSSGLIVQYCRARGVDGVDTVKKAWKEFRQHQKLLHEGRPKQHTSSGTA